MLREGLFQGIEYIIRLSKSRPVDRSHGNLTPRLESFERIRLFSIASHLFSVFHRTTCQDVV